MKTVEVIDANSIQGNIGDIRRIPNKDAELAVNRGSCKYVPKSRWKNEVRDINLHDKERSA